ncbi:MULTISPECIES: ABC transporter substrate-binding protein [Bradyrhizobium]|uniref:ABC transporter substrate-binding protein n=4 Tax=Nitrobacteraceae TaxID=41294 RepID=A0ABS5G5Q6_9BRAD|nr:MULTISPECIES: ABC transporter substrate-binding protein [unclassified Bradyrhizobium]MBR1136510.1 ABC transporter substrate-binding protein [Bradyrhizobium denitrificans]MDU3096970.1 ABC transporter substrate-binding protein [Bradyrhizobium sp.]MDU6139001.1 ABC transporter substrate-binding protein [Bradyrhizobium sp.]MDU6324074.1 ABC transporter substrate-binding protein [Bradyrhizobium sp.]MDU6648517.1 ABC transporter substrate-binding protein [Bradyrhizobium sp.]
MQEVPSPPRERRSIGWISLLAILAFAAAAGYAATKLPAHWVGVITADSRAASSVTAAVPPAPAPLPPAAAPSPDVPATGTTASVAPAPAADASTRLREEDHRPKFDSRVANAVPAPREAATQSSVQGVTDTEIRFGMAAPFSGPAREMGHQLKLGVDLAFAQANEEGGVHGRQLKLVTADDAYEPNRTLNAMKELFEQHKVFGFVENYGSPTALISVPYALERHTLYFGAFSGAPSLRRDPPDRYVFNYRAGYAEEADAIVHYLVRNRRLRPQDIGVLTQQDAYGEAGWEGVTKAMRTLRGGVPGEVFRMSYNRNTVNVDEAIAQLRRQRPAIKAVVLVATFRAAAKFIEKTRDLYPDMIYATISGVGSTGLASELMVLGPHYADGVICTQVTPAVDGYATVTMKYKNALAKYFPGEPADYSSLEAYLTASILIEGLRRAGPALDTESLVNVLESMQNYELGLGPKVSFGPSDHQALHKVWGTQLDKSGQYHAIDLE